MSLLAGSEPFSIDGGRIGVLVSHGFTGMPASMRPWAEHLAAQGYTVRLPLLPGHGTSWQDMNTTTWQDWYATIEAAYDELAARCDQVFVCGLSMGGTLVTRLAEEKGDAVAGVVLVNPAYATERKDAALAKYISWLVKSMPGIASDIKKPGVTEPGYDRTPVKAFVSLQQLWKTVLADLGKITAPVLLLRSREDHVVEPLSGRLLQSNATSTTVREIVLENSYHVATLDNDAPLIFDESVRFISDLVRPSADEPA
ncbi:esterase/lipase [Jatrophihabitans sp. GAS493]|uniref:alpha/beta hydrolase n=1 Tax=Jatrophihabitans sp. GAS493 TaxID=1907575 RepID=UPI000BB90917|nr:alpha/beta fold hydrolase [Jatrophihabitans sp. GAS493]SOD74371.1 esterase/lipase [Jatrophihabitans sp. GAS493]